MVVKIVTAALRIMHHLLPHLPGHQEVIAIATAIAIVIVIAIVKIPALILEAVVAVAVATVEALLQHHLILVNQLPPQGTIIITRQGTKR